MKKPAGSVSREFRDFVSKNLDPDDPLSLVHTTDMLGLDQIEKTDRLMPTGPDACFGEAVVCCFYGRPSYRVNSQVKNTKVSAFAPVCFVFRRSIAWNAKRVYPFDTGAFALGLLEQVIHPSFAAQDFEIDSTPDGPRAIVGTFYDSNADYMDGKPGNKIDPTDLSRRRLFRVEAYDQLIRYAPNDRVDERVHSIEVQTAEPMPLKDNLLAIVIPARFFGKDDTMALETKWNCRVVGYSIKDTFTPTELMSLVFDKVREVLVSDGQIS